MATPKASSYVKSRQLSNLNDRAIKLIERLQYQMSFGEAQESGIGTQATKRFPGFSFKRSRSITREMRPFTILSLTEEYRRFIEDVKIYLNDVLQQEAENEEEAPKVRIIIAIDELDKILNTQRLHEMLKSMKSIFEIPQVYYILSISEDALETYRLRHLETKNEIDSAFSHIFSIPPMDADTSVEKVLKDVDETALHNFIRENPCPVGEARQVFHNLRSLVRSMAIKRYIYKRTGKLETPAAVKTWEKSAEEYYKSLPGNSEIDKGLKGAEPLQDSEIDRWLKGLEPLRNAVFELANNPLGVWEEIKK